MIEVTVTILLDGDDYLKGATAINLKNAWDKGDLTVEEILEAAHSVKVEMEDK